MFDHGDREIKKKNGEGKKEEENGTK